MVDDLEFGINGVFVTADTEAEAQTSFETYSNSSRWDTPPEIVDIVTVNGAGELYRYLQDSQPDFMATVFSDSAAIIFDRPAYFMKAVQEAYKAGLKSRLEKFKDLLEREFIERKPCEAGL